MNLPGMVLLLSLVVFAQQPQPSTDTFHPRKAFAQELSNDISRSKAQKVYVADFTDESGKPSFLGRYYAATFAGMLQEAAMGFAVLDRVEVCRSLTKTGITDRDSVDPQQLTKLVSDLGADAILWGKVSLNHDVATIDVVLRTPAGNDLLQRRYQETLDSGLRADLEANQSGSIFYKPGLDGVSLPECVQCPSPDWPTGQGSPGRDGNVMLSILVTLEGNPEQMRVIDSLDPIFDRAALECVRSWRFKPAKDADGNPVPVRLPVQITFKRRWQIR